MKTKERALQRNKLWRDNHPNECRIYRRKSLSKMYHKRRLIIIDHYTNNTRKCQCCGESIFQFLTIDHINNDGNKQRKEMGLKSNHLKLMKWIIMNNFPPSIQILCYNCNLGRRHVTNKICPHKLTNSLLN